MRIRAQQRAEREHQIALKNTRRVPKVSASQPETGIITAIVSEYAITTDCIRSGDSPRLAAIDGSAVFTMVASSVCMKKPVATSQSITVRFFRRGRRQAGAGTWGGRVARDSRHCRESRRVVPVRRKDGAESGQRVPVPVDRPVQFSQKCLQPYLSVCCHCPKY